LRHYYPDFIVKTSLNEYFLIELKGLEDIDVAYKDKRARLWCEDVQKLTKENWSFIRIKQEDFERYRFLNTLKELISI